MKTILKKEKKTFSRSFNQIPKLMKNIKRTFILDSTLVCKSRIHLCQMAFMLVPYGKLNGLTSIMRDNVLQEERAYWNKYILRQTQLDFWCKLNLVQLKYASKKVINRAMPDLSKDPDHQRIQTCNVKKRSLEILEISQFTDEKYWISGHQLSMLWL